jgi:hypothetical protein
MGVAYLLGGDDPHLEIVMPNPDRSFAGLPTTRRDDGPWVRDRVLVVPIGAGP